MQSVGVCGPVAESVAVVKSNQELETWWRRTTSTVSALQDAAERKRTPTSLFALDHELIDHEKHAIVVRANSAGLKVVDGGVVRALLEVE